MTLVTPMMTSFKLTVRAVLFLHVALFLSLQKLLPTDYYRVGESDFGQISSLPCSCEHPN